MELTKDQIMNWLEEVKDPEIPVLSLVDLGVITSVDISGSSVTVEMTPTFVGCPALDAMKEDVVQALTMKGVANTRVVVSFREPWTSDKITAKGKEALKKFGLAPPPPNNQLFTDLEILERPMCPRCDGSNTELKNPFGPTLCRAIYYCHTCKEAFEQFKPL
jgi:ring-1,2-phenylacetyl-CoA epoxidase subunit PaaD